MLTKFKNNSIRIREDIGAQISPKLRKMRYSEILYQEIFRNGIRDAGNSTDFQFFSYFQTRTIQTSCVLALSCSQF